MTGYNSEADREIKQTSHDTHNGVLLGFFGGAITGSLVGMKHDQPYAHAHSAIDQLAYENVLLAKLNSETGKHEIKPSSTSYDSAIQKKMAQNNASIAKLEKTTKGELSRGEGIGIILGPAIVGALVVGLATNKISRWRSRPRTENAPEATTS